MKLTELLEGRGTYRSGGNWDSGGYDSYRDKIDARKAETENDTAGEVDESRKYVSIPYKLKDAARKFFPDLKWDSIERSWYTTSYNLMLTVDDWVRRKEKAKNKEGGRIYLRVPFSSKDYAKGFGARWDGVMKQWYYDGEELPSELNRYRDKG